MERKESIFSPRPPRPAETTFFDEEQYVMVFLHGKQHTQLPLPIHADPVSTPLSKTAMTLFKFIVGFY